MAKKPKLVIEDFGPYGDDIGIGWDFCDGEGVNLFVGDTRGMANCPVPDDDERHLWAAEVAAAKYIAEHPDAVKEAPRSPYSRAYHFTSEKHGRAVLALAKAAVAEVLSKKAPLADWEQKALAAGWKPPKGRL